MIKEIFELLQIGVNEHGKTHIQNKLEALPPLRRQLVSFIRDKPDISDAELCYALYGTSTSSKYSKLKKRTYNNFIDILFFSTNVNINEHHKYDQRRARCLKYFSLLRILIIKNARVNVLTMANYLMKESRDIEMNEIAFETIKMLLEHYGLVDFNPKIYKKLKVEYDELNLIKSLEDQLQVGFYSLFSRYSEYANSTEKIVFEWTLRDLEDVVKSNYSFKSTMLAYRIKMLQFEIRNDFVSLEEAAIEAIEVISRWKWASDRILTNFRRRKFVAQLKLKKSNAILDSLKEFEAGVSAGSIDYFVVSIFKVLMYFHVRQYMIAVEVLNEMRSNKNHLKLPDHIRENFEILYGYGALLIELTLVDFEEGEEKKFRINKLINDVPFYQKDKRGANISILVLHIIFSLKNRKYDQLIDRTAALQQYSYRYLRKDDTFRSNCFIKMIIQMTKADFHPIRTERYTAELFEKLKSVPLELSEQPLEVEIIPYEDLWEMILQLLEKNSKIKRGRPKKA